MQRLAQLIDRYLWFWYGASAFGCFAILFGVSGVGWMVALAVALVIMVFGLVGITTVRVATGEWPGRKKKDASAA